MNNFDTEKILDRNDYDPVKIGDTVRLEKGWGGDEGGKEGVIIEIEYGKTSETGMVILTEGIFTDGEEHWLDRNWFIKVNKLF
jgi:hypothetical protein